MKQTLERGAASAREQAQQLGEGAQRQARQMSSDLQDQAQKVVSEQKEMAASGIMDIVSAIRSAADDLETHQQGQVASMARGLAGGLEDFSQSIGRRNFQDMVSDVERFARDHPTAFFGGALLAGLAMARFAKSSSRHQTAARSAAQRAGQGGQLAEFARQEREHGLGPAAGSTR
ncbi:MAG: hypothetical protein KJZ80_21015 [Hyphomicrobiaceae bacterium]|nr:hypothetical protein [Hyphomicrobiaceae bacterium]